VLILQIDPGIVVALIGVFAGALPVGLSYVATKNKEINANIRAEKIKRYDDLVGAITAIVMTGFENDHKQINHLVSANNRAHAYASDLVLEKCNDLLDAMTKEVQTGVLTPDGSDRIIAAINQVYVAIRKDINPKAKYSDVRTIWAVPKEGKV